MHGSEGGCEDATNAAPFPFEWVDYEALKTRYATLLARVCKRYEAAS